MVLRNGVPILARPVIGDQVTITLPGAAPGDYRLQLMRGSAFEAMSNPITLVAP
jgi:hypothetical protein